MGFKGTVTVDSSHTGMSLRLAHRGAIIALTAFLLLFHPLSTLAAATTIRYVDKDNTSDTETGLTWDTAFTTIQPAIDAAYNAGGGEVWVAEGTYDEQRTATSSEGAVIMRDGVGLLGGFIGIGEDGYETSHDQRNWKQNRTTVDGSTARNGKPARHVVIGADNATLDGFTVTGGNANGSTSSHKRGGGMYNVECSPSVVNCMFTGNSAAVYGGGMYTQDSTTAVTNCTFAANSALRGGGKYARDSTTSVMNCTFTANSASYGGAMYTRDSTTSVTNCTFVANSAGNSGGGRTNHRRDYPRL